MNFSMTYSNTGNILPNFPRLLTNIKTMKIGTYNKNKKGDYIRSGDGRFSSLGRKIKNFFRKCIWVSVIASLVYGVYLAGGIFQPRAIAVESIVEVDKPSPVLERIIKCESGGKHFDRSGQVLMRSNTNKTVDLGLAQINTVWFAKATELGYDLTKEEDNRAMATWIIKNKGTSPWSATFSCWNR